jgi:hypothetical protein
MVSQQMSAKGREWTNNRPSCAQATCMPPTVSLVIKPITAVNGSSLAAVNDSAFFYFVYSFCPPRNRRFPESTHPAKGPLVRHAGDRPA